MSFQTSFFHIGIQTSLFPMPREYYMFTVYIYPCVTNNIYSFCHMPTLIFIPNVILLSPNGSGGYSDVTEPIKIPVMN